MKDRDQRTEQPTPRRLERARKEGQFLVSREFVSAVQFSLFVYLFTAWGAGWVATAGSAMRAVFAAPATAELTTARLERILLALAGPVLFPVAGLCALLVAVSLGAHLVVTRGGVALKRLTPSLDRLNPLSRLRQMPRRNAQQLLYSALLLPLFLLALYQVVSDSLAEFLSLPMYSLPAALRRVTESVNGLLWKAVVLFLALGLIDMFRQWRRHNAEMRMTRQEVVDEHKEVEGSPQTKMRIRRLRRDLLRRRMMRDVATATAVVVNPMHYAVALKYRPEEMPAPKVVAKGKNYLALRIRQRAVENQVPVVENPPLARALYGSAEVGQEIPTHLYRAVAEILAYIYRLMHGRFPGR